MRESIDQLTKRGTIENGFDYNLQVWVKGGVIQNCGHQVNAFKGHGCCNARKLHGRNVEDVQGHENRYGGQ